MIQIRKLIRLFYKKRFRLIMLLTNLVLKICKQDSEEYMQGIKETPYGGREYTFHIKVVLPRR